jgi:hypothetical protein
MTRFYSSTAQPTTLSAAATSSATTIQVTATTGFPAVEFILALDYGTAQQELVKVTNVAGTTLTVVRGFDSTTAQAHSLGAAVRHVHSADDFRLSRTHEAASSGVHGATGALVGTTDAQALTNKDLTSGTNTFPASLATDAELSAHTGATAAHGATGAVVGTTNTQALTNKDLTSGTNTFPTSLATLTGAQTLTNKTITSAIFLAGTLTQLPLIKCTSATRPANVDGQAIYETDTDRILIADGTNWTRVTGSEAASGAGGTLGATATSYASVTLPPGRWTIIGKGHASGSATGGGGTAMISAQADLFDGTSALDTVTLGESITSGGGSTSVSLDTGFSLLYVATLTVSTTVNLRAKVTAGTASVSDIKLSAIPG